MTRLEPMDQQVFETWRADSVRDYAADKVASGNWLASEAVELSERAFAELLPSGLETVGHELRSIVDDSGTKAGVVWFTIEERPFGRVVFI